MAVSPALRSLDIDLPACPQTLVRLSLLMADEAAHIEAIAGLIGADMALASAVVRSVNSAHFGLLRRVESVPEAVNYLGKREVGALTYEIALRSAFPPAPLLGALWERAGLRGLVMGRAAGPLDVDPWLAHTAGIFAESGMAALFAHDSVAFEGAVRRAQGDLRVLMEQEIEVFGVSHAALGGALCQAWGLSSQVSAVVRLRPLAASELLEDWTRELPAVRRMLALCLAADLAIEGMPLGDIAARCEPIAGQAGMDSGALCEAVLTAHAGLR
ncbi:MAG TPA: HDOD domain-containing protein [Burkholderiaceae bacterium]|jgi:HD-like signal output (HDOD) protein|nr:HDOD domain-containing protein [Burkholderiaceae bacterium]